MTGTVDASNHHHETDPATSVRQLHRPPRLALSDQAQRGGCAGRDGVFGRCTGRGWWFPCSVRGTGAGGGSVTLRY